MPLKLFPPGTRKRNRYYVAKGRLRGVQHEFVCRDENGEKTADRRAAERCIGGSAPPLKPSGKVASLAQVRSGRSPKG